MNERKKIYLKKIKDVAGFHVWYVNGYWIRKHIDPNFVIYGQHHRYRYIPENEFWIDKENGATEKKYYIEHLLIENKLMEAGESYLDANERAAIIEKAERAKDKFIVKLEKEHKQKRIDNVHKKFFRRLSGKVKVWLVRGNLVRSLFFTDFTQGGHDKVYPFIPKGEVWIDDDVYKKEIPFIVLHELHERYLMGEGFAYDPEDNRTMIKSWNKKVKIYKSAHEQATEIEFYCRHHPNKIKKQLRLEIKRNKV